MSMDHGVTFGIFEMFYRGLQLASQIIEESRPARELIIFRPSDLVPHRRS